MSNQNEEPNEITNDSVVLPTKTSDIQVEVCNPQVKDDTFNKYVAYTLKGTDKHGAFEVVRRYNDFDKVRAMLIARWPGCYIPPLPPKALNSLEAKVVRERRKYLSRFCQKISEITYLHYDAGYQEFLRNKSSGIEKTLHAFMNVEYEEIIARYVEVFAELSGKEYNLQVISKITNFKTFLKKAQGQMDNFKKIAREMSRSKAAFYQEFSALNNLVTMQFEKAILTEYHGGDESKNAFYGPNGSALYQFAEKVEEGSKRPSLEYLEEWIKAESREVEAFIEALDQKDVYDTLKSKSQTKQKSESDDLQKVLSGKTTIKGVFSRKSKDEQVSSLEKNIAKYTKNYDDLSKLSDMIVLVLAYEEIDKFKNNKMTPYFNVVRIATQNELAALLNMEDYWKTVLKSPNIADIDEEK